MPLLATAQAVLVLGCSGSHPRPEPPAVSASACVVAPKRPTSAPDADHGDASRDVEVALRRAVNPSNAPAARDESERLVFRQLYETAIRIDCEGRARPGLAASWSHDRDGQRWWFTLRPGAHFWDETPVSAQAVARSWASSDATRRGRGGEPLIASVGVVSERELTVLLSEPSTEAAMFASPALAVAGAGTYGGWPLGSGPYRPLMEPEASPGEVRVVAEDSARTPTSITFRHPENADARGALDRGVDVLVSEDPEVLAYARALPGFTTEPLPWSRTYVVAAAEAAGRPRGGIPSDALDRLARGAVRAAARPARPPFWWRDENCSDSETTRADATQPQDSAPSRTLSAGAASRIVYPAGDPVARAIAERLVGLAGLGSASPPWLSEAVPALDATSSPPVAAELDPVSLAWATREGEALAFVIPVPRAPGGPCVSASLGEEDDVVRIALAPASGLRITPLLDVRSSVVIRSGIAGIGIDGDGTLVFHPGETPR